MNLLVLGERAPCICSSHSGMQRQKQARSCKWCKMVHEQGRNTSLMHGITTEKPIGEGDKGEKRAHQGEILGHGQYRVDDPTKEGVPPVGQVKIRTVPVGASQNRSPSGREERGLWGGGVPALPSCAVKRPMAIVWRGADAGAVMACEPTVVTFL